MNECNGVKPRRKMSIISALDDVYKEIEIMKQMNHKNIIKLSEIIDDPF